MLNGLIGGALLVAAVTGYSLTLLHLIAREVQRIRWRREFDGWRIIQQRRIARAGRTGSRPAGGAARQVHPCSGLGRGPVAAARAEGGRGPRATLPAHNRARIAYRRNP